MKTRTTACLPWRSRSVSGILVLFLALLLCGGRLVGCASQPPPPPAEVPVPGYDKLQESFAGIDIRPLKDRRIVLDPGHGGFFRGALGPGGLSEADVNLGVALYLRGLLEWVGAEVFMTRTADVDFLTPEDSTLVSDLAFRVSFTDSLQPDVFLSIHHNSTASLDRTLNETQTYYPLGRDDASVDLARAIHRHLVLNLEIEPAKVLPGNFHVLRNATVPAVLGEPAMISHPMMEKKLSLAASQRLEAEAYFLGLLDYFAGGSPRWAGSTVDTLRAPRPGFSPPVQWTFLAEDRPDSVGDQGWPGPGPDPGSFVLRLDGEFAPFDLTPDGREVLWPGGSLDPGRTAVLELTGRNLRGRSTPLRRTVLLPAEPAVLSLRLSYDLSDETSPVVAVTVDSPEGTPIPEGEIRFQDTEILTFSDGPGPHENLVTMTARTAAALAAAPSFVPAGTAVQSIDALLPTVVVVRDTLAANLGWHRIVSLDPRTKQLMSFTRGRWRFRGASTAGSSQTNLVAWPHDRATWFEARGYLPLIDPGTGGDDVPRTHDASARSWNGRFLFPELMGKTIVLDPAGGGTVTDGMGTLGLRGEWLNLEVLRHTARLLEGAGARVVLTRTGTTVPPAEAKVLQAGREDADLFLTLGRVEGPGPVTVRHHPGSDAGEIWSTEAARAVSRLLAADDTVRIEPSYDYLLRHTACPAIEVQLPMPDGPGQELVMNRPGWHRAEARALFLSVAALLNGDSLWDFLVDPADLIARLPGGLDPETVEYVVMDGNLPWSPIPVPSVVENVPGSLDSVAEPGIPALGRLHTLEIHSRENWQLWLLQREGAEIVPRLMKEG